MEARRVGEASLVARPTVFRGITPRPHGSQLHQQSSELTADTRDAFSAASRRGLMEAELALAYSPDAFSAASRRGLMEASVAALCCPINRFPRHHAAASWKPGNRCPCRCSTRRFPRHHAAASWKQADACASASRCLMKPMPDSVFRGITPRPHGSSCAVEGVSSAVPSFSAASRRGLMEAVYIPSRLD